MQLRDYVERGVELLDEQAPGWEHKINLSTLVLWHGCHCICGQIYGSYVQALDELEIGPHAPASGYHYGFHLPPSTEEEYTWSELQELWIEVIQGRTMPKLETELLEPVPA